jgi:hypothetical protein
VIQNTVRVSVDTARPFTIPGKGTPENVDVVQDTPPFVEKYSPLIPPTATNDPPFPVATEYKLSKSDGGVVMLQASIIGSGEVQIDVEALTT